MQRKQICGIDAESYFIRMEEFHGYRSPGMLIGGLMIEKGLEQLGPTPYLNVVSETIVCLPDAVQLLTSCTVGNGFLQVLDWGKFALTAYDRECLKGVRVWLNQDRLSGYPLIAGWFTRTGKPRDKPPFNELAKEVLSAEPELLASSRVRLPQPLKDRGPVPTGQCPECGESYPLRHGRSCFACQGKAYYRMATASRGGP